MRRLSIGCGNALWRVWVGCLENVGDCLEGVGMLSGGHGEVVLKVCVRYLECVMRLSGGWGGSGEAPWGGVLRVWGGYLEG